MRYGIFAVCAGLLIGGCTQRMPAEAPAAYMATADMLTDAVTDMLLQTQEMLCVRLAADAAWDTASCIAAAQQSQVLAGTMLRTVTWAQTGDLLTLTAVYTDAPETVRERKQQLADLAQQWAETVRPFSPDILVLLAHDLLVNRCTYADSGAECHTAYGALLGGGAVCDGYAEGFALLTEAAGIPVQVITGTVRQPDGSTVPHAWNLVCLDGAWYHIDCTRDDTGETAQHSFFLCSDTSMQPVYVWDTAAYPPADGTVYCYTDIVQRMLDYCSLG